MGKTQKFLEQQLEKIPREMLQRLVEKKLHVAGVHSEPLLVDQIISRILNNDPSPFQWNDENSDHRTITLSISDEDIKEVEKVFSRLTESLPDIVDKISTAVAQSTLKELKRKWREENLFQQAEFNIFRNNLEKRWGKSLGMLRMLLTMARELGGEITKLRPPDNSYLNNVLLHLHVRACQVTAEVITLLENGFADGAMARWRTLHEISIVMALMNEHGEQLAERYIAHRAVEAKDGKDQYQLCYEKLGYQALTQKECNEIEKEYEAAILKYGKEFKGPYGWAAGYVPKGQRGIGLKEIEMAAGQSAMASHYKLASHNVHAGPHALFFRLGLIDIDENALLAGASNAGLTEPGQNTAVSLAFISVLLAKDCADLDFIIMMKIIAQFRNEIPQAFAQAENKLRKDHVRHTKINRAHNKQQIRKITT